MHTSKNPLRFDHREVAVIFSLFIFVSLLMFTVGILVGKGLAQARYESIVAAEAERIKLSAAAPFSPQNVPAYAAGTSVSTPVNDHASAEVVRPVETPAIQPSARLELVPEDTGNVMGSLKEPVENPEVSQVLRNPKLRNIFETEQKVHRSVASAVPASFPSGKFLVQVGSYPGEKEAEVRVGTLKKLGFPHAFFSAKEFREKNDTWFRVWLGYFPDETRARLAGQSLKDQGEVKDYLVREADRVSEKN